MKSFTSAARPFAFGLLVFGLAWLGATGCGQEVSSPTPNIDTDREGGATTPGFRCSAQEDSWVELHGENFTPLVIGTLSDDGPDVSWPSVRITRVEDMNGESVDGKTVEIQSTGKIVEGEDSSNTMEMAQSAADAGDAGDTGSADTGSADTGSEDTGIADTGMNDTGTEDTESGMGEDTASGTEDTGMPSDDTGTTGGETGTGGGADAGGEGPDRHLVWLSDAKLRFKVTPDMNLKPGKYDVTVVSGRTPGDESNAETAKAGKALGILPPPSLESVAGMQPICVKQKARTITITGQHFMRQGDQTPTIEVGRHTLEPKSMSGCNQPGGPFGDYELCTEMTVEVPADESAVAGSRFVNVKNFDPAACESLPAQPEGEKSSVRVLNPPKVFEVAPDPICSKQADYTVTITGEDFVATGEANPTVEIGGYTAENVELEDCMPLEGNVGEDAQKCSTIKADVAAGEVGGDAVDRSEVSVTNPGMADCAAEKTTEITSVAPPVVSEVDPQPIVAADDGSMSAPGDTANRVVLEGQRFAQLDGARPTVTVSDGGGTMETYDATALGGCSELEGPGQMRVNLCTTLEFVIPEGDFRIPAGQEETSLQVEVTNPDPLSCSSSPGMTEELQVVDPPELTDVQTTPICTESQDKPVAVNGEGFIIYDGTGPTVGVGMNAYRATKGPDANCSPIGTDGSATVEECDQIEFTAPKGALRSTELPVTVYNPEQVGGYTTEDSEEQKLTVLDAPRVAYVQPELTCLEDGARTLTFHGQKFLRVVPGGMDPPKAPTVDFAQTSATVTDSEVPNPSQNCTDFSVPGRSELFQMCDRVEVTVEGAGQTGLAEARVRNPAPADCQSTAVHVTIDPKPRVSSVEVRPQSSCDENGFRRIVVSGDKFLDADGTMPKVTFDGSTTYETQAANNCSPVPNTPNSDFRYCDEIVVYGETSVVEGQTDVSVENPSPSSCASPDVGFDVTANCP